MQTRNTIIALVVLAAIGGYIYFFQAGKSAEQASKLFKVKADEITRVVLKYPKQEIEVERDGGKWKMVKPIEAPADASAISTLTREIANCSIKRTVDEHPASLADYGLDKPEVTVIASTKDKTLPGIEVGKTTPIGYSVYIKTTDKPAVMLANGSFGPGTKRTVADLRDHTLMAFKVDNVNKVVLTRTDAAPIELQRQDGKWQITKPEHYLADPNRVREMLSSLSSARIDQFISDNPTNDSQYGLAKPIIKVAVYSGPGQAVESLDFGERENAKGKDAYYVRRGERPNVYTVHSYVYTDVNKSVNDLRDRTVFAFAPQEVDQIKFSTGKGQPFELTRTGKDKWTLNNGTKAAADPVKVSQFMDRLKALQAESIVADSPPELAKFGLVSPNEQATMLGKDGKPIGWVKLAKVERRNEKGKNAPVVRTDYYAMSSAVPTVYKIFDYDYSDLIKTSGQFAMPKPKPSPEPTAKK